MWLLPSKDRPERAQAAIDAMVRHGIKAPGQVLYSGAGYRWLDLPDGWEAIAADDLRCLPACDLGYRRRPDAPWYGFASDDMAAQTADFEAALSKAAGRFNIACADDGWQFTTASDKLPGFFVLGGDLVRAVGWIAPPGLQHSFIDNAWHDIGAALGAIVMLHNVMLAHEHAWNGRAKMDATYRANYADIERDQEIYTLWRERDLAPAVDRVKKAMADAR